MLANYFECKVIIIQPSNGPGRTTRLYGYLYQPGWKAQSIIRKSALKKLAKKERLVLIYLDNPPRHYEACVCSTDAPLDVDACALRKSTKDKSASVVVLSDSD